MDYEKKYNEALERAKDFKNGIVQFALDPGESIVHYIFPELRESEDERIRRRMVEHFKSKTKETWCSIPVKDILKWLEKQKVLTEHKEGIYYYHRDGTFTFINPPPALENPHDFTVPKPNEKPVDYDHEMWKNCEANFEGGKKEVIYHPEKYGLQKEQKPNYCHYGGDPSVERCKYCSTSCSGRLVEERYSPLCNTIKDKIHEYIANHFIADTVVKTDMRSIVKAMEEGVRLGKEEQKPNYCHHEVDETGWTEEYRKAYYDGWNNCNMQHEQLKADQKPAEWSEEDELMRTAVIQTLERFGGRGTTGMQIDWLRSLRPSWKPSEDEERLINTAISFLKDFANKGYENAVECIDWLKSKLNGNSGK